LRPLRILLTLHYPLDANAGAAGCTLRLAEALRERDHEVSFFTVDDMRARRDSRLDLLNFPFQASAVALRRLRAGDVDVVDASTGDLWPATKRMIERAPGIAVTRSHGLENREAEEALKARDRGELELKRRYFLYYGGARLKQVARSLRVADAALLLNPRERDWVIDHLAIRPDRAKVVRNGLADAFIGLPPPSRVDPQQIGIAVVGPFSWQKGATTTAKVLSEVLRRNPTARASWLGAPESEVRPHVDPAVWERVHVQPRFVNADLPALLAGHQVLLMLSRSEGFPGVVLEGLACGLAVVSTDVSSCRDLLERAGAGVIVPPADVDAIVGAIERLMAQPEGLDEIRRRGHREAQGLGWAGVAADVEAIYREILVSKSA
jgi:glycosyltransferase involved in cell wall biosynthesis